MKTIRLGGDAKNAALPSERKGNLRDKRRDPWHRLTHRQKRWQTCAGWPGGEWFTSTSRPGPQVSGRNHWLKRANKPHPIVHVPRGLERPCYEADNSASHGEWRRGATDLHRRCQMVATGKSVWRAPTPQFVPVGLRSDRDFLFLTRVCSSKYLAQFGASVLNWPVAPIILWVKFMTILYRPWAKLHSSG